MSSPRSMQRQPPPTMKAADVQDSVVPRQQFLAAKSVHDLSPEVAALMQECRCDVKTDPKTGITRRTMTIQFRDRRIPVMKYTTYTRAK